MNVPALGRAHARVIWFAIAALLAGAVAGALVATTGAPPAAAAGLGTLLLGVACVTVGVDLGVGFFVASRIRKNAPPSAPPDGVAATQVIVGAATALSGGLVSAIFFFITQHGVILLLALPCAAALLSWFPSERRWAALRPAAAQAPGASRPNPLVRG